MTTIEDMAREFRSNQQAVMDWNVLATAKNHEQGQLARLLKRFGDFRWTLYLGVLIGRVEDHRAFFDQLRRSEEEKPGFLLPLAKLVPLDKIFTFEMQQFVPMLKAEVVPYVDRIGSGSFYVRIERRGHKGVIHSQQIEEELARTVADVQAQRGYIHRVDFKDPDVIIAIEIVGNECGVGMITKPLRERYPFIKVP